MDDRVEARIARIENQLRHSRWAVGILGCLLLISSQTQSSSLSLRKLEIVDGKGQPRIVIEADPAPRLAFTSPAGQGRISLGIGGDDYTFPFDQQDVPHIVLETGLTKIQLAASPAPQKEGLGKEFRVESALLQMSSTQSSAGEMQSKSLTVGVFPNKATIGIATFDPAAGVASLMDPGVKLEVDANGKAKARLEQEKGK